MSKGGDQTGSTVYNWNPYMENMWAGGQDGNIGLLGRAVETLNSPYQQYGGERVAGFTPDQGYAMDRVRNDALYGSTLGNAGRNTSLDTVQGDYLNSLPNSGVQYGGQSSWGAAVPLDRQGYENPYYTQSQNVPGQYQGQGPNASLAQGGIDMGSTAQNDRLNPVLNNQQYNPMLDNQQLGVGQNQFMGPSSQFDSMVNRGMGKITEQYNSGVGADIRRAANLSGAFGGSAHAAQLEKAQSGLAENLGNYANQMYDQQWNRSANLQESDLGRQMQSGMFNIQGGRDNANTMNQAQQYNIGNMRQNADIQNQAQMYNIGLGDKNIDRSMLAQQFNTGLSGQNADRMNQMSQFNAGNDQQSYENWANRQFTGSGNDISRMSDYYNQFLNRDLQAQQFNKTADIGVNQNYWNNQMNADQFNASLGASNWNAERDRMNQAMQGAMGSEQYNMGLYNNLYGMGSEQQQYNQAGLDRNYGDWQDQQSWERNNLNWMGNLLAQAQGGIGGQTTMYGDGGASGWQQALGAGLMGYGMFGS